jgi:hypothetical protein
MIIIDFSQTIISNLMAELKGRTDVDIELPLLRHMVINTLRSYKNKFKDDYGQLVIACDSREKYWRKEYFPYYKSNRKRDREASGYDWNLIFDAINLIKKEIKINFPYKVLEIPGAEADDIIASLCKWSRLNTQESVLIISGDHDFFQLQDYKKIKQFSPIKNKFVKADRPSSDLVLEHIIKGDRGDGIPNVLSDDDSIITGTRQKKIMQTKLDEWIKDPTSMPSTETFLRNYHRNKQLVDLSMIPKHIEAEIINMFENYDKKDKSNILNYFIDNKMKNLIEHMEEF